MQTSYPTLIIGDDMQPNPNLKNPHLEGGPFFWPAGPTGILLCHGYTATSAEVRQLAPLLHGRGYTVAGPLLPGHGTSPQDANRYRWQDWVAAIESTYQELTARCQRVILGGESTGALLSLFLAAQHPETIAILCYAPALKLNISKFDQLRLRLLAPFVTGVPKGNIDRDDLWQGYRVNPLKGALQLLHLQSQVRRLLPQIHQPILILQGRLDETVSPQVPQIIYDEIASQVKGLYWMEHSSHCVILDKELDRVAEITLDFLNKVLSSTDIDS
jgi:carboxylesterase